MAQVPEKSLSIGAINTDTRTTCSELTPEEEVAADYYKNMRGQCFAGLFAFSAGLTGLAAARIVGWASNNLEITVAIDQAYGGAITPEFMRDLGERFSYSTSYLIALGAISLSNGLRTSRRLGEEFGAMVSEGPEARSRRLKGICQEYEWLSGERSKLGKVGVAVGAYGIAGAGVAWALGQDPEAVKVGVNSIGPVAEATVASVWSVLDGYRRNNFIARALSRFSQPNNARALQ